MEDRMSKGPRWPKFVRSSGVVLAAVLLATAAQGQESTPAADEYGPDAGEWEFTLSGTGGSDNEFNRGAFGLSTSLGYFLSDAFEAGARHSMTFFDADDTDLSFMATTRVFADYHLDFDRVQPFLGANLGVRYGNNHTDTTGLVAPEAGVKFFALENTFILAMAEYQFFFEDINESSGDNVDGEFVYTIGLGFNF